jgi:hypothetical protein
VGATLGGGVAGATVGVGAGVAFTGTGVGAAVRSAVGRGDGEGGGVGVDLGRGLDVGSGLDVALSSATPPGMPATMLGGAGGTDAGRPESIIATATAQIMATAHRATGHNRITVVGGWARQYVRLG